MNEDATKFNLNCFAKIHRRPMVQDHLAPLQMKKRVHLPRLPRKQRVRWDHHWDPLPLPRPQLPQLLLLDIPKIHHCNATQSRRNAKIRYLSPSAPYPSQLHACLIRVWIRTVWAGPSVSDRAFTAQTKMPTLHLAAMT